MLGNQTRHLIRKFGLQLAIGFNWGIINYGIKVNTIYKALGGPGIK
jgi:hypothetical protein